MEILAHILGVVGVVVSAISMIMKTKTKVVLLLAVYNLLTLISYLLLGHFLSCILVVIAIFRSLTFLLYEVKKIKNNWLVLLSFNIVIICISIVLWDKWYDIFLLICTLIFTFTTWQKNVKLIKWGTIICTPLFVTFDILAGAYVYIISELAFGISAIVSLITTKYNSKSKHNDV